mmetsp:Transcript_45797/g.107016  ORF Transcript_45797/g.107016 Transcript_45797/m.107016 type:complete len:287 (+) Transcript_45797:79-939(+)
MTALSMTELSAPFLTEGTAEPWRETWRERAELGTRVEGRLVPGTPLVGSFSAHKKATNAMLVKAELGRVKKTTYKLPGPEHTYGKALFREDEGTGELVMGWMDHVPNPHAKPGRDFKALNKGAVVSGAVTSKQQVAYRKTHDARLKIGSHEDRRFTLADGYIHGRSTRPSTPMIELISSAYRWSWVAEHLESGQNSPMASKKLNPPAATKASKGHSSMLRSPGLAQSSYGSSGKEPFVMKRFQNIPAKVTQYMPNKQPNRTSAVSFGDAAVEEAVEVSKGAAATEE